MWKWRCGSQSTESSDSMAREPVGCEGPSDRAALAMLGDLATPWAIRAIVRNGVVQTLRAGAMDVSSLARRNGLDADALRRGLRLLAHHQLVTLSGDRCELGPLGRLLDPEAAGTLFPQFADTSFNRVLDHCRSDVGLSFTTGNPVICTGEFWVIARAEPTGSTLFDRMMETRSAEIEDRLFVDWESSEPAHIADIGCGPAAVLGKALRAFPEAQGIGIDNYPTAGSAVLRDVSIASRFTLRVANFFDDALPSDIDLYLLTSILHDWPDSACLDLLRNLTKYMGAKSSLMVVERVRSTEGDSAGHLRLDMDMLVALGGRERTLGELLALGLKAGLFAVRHRNLSGDYLSIEFRKIITEQEVER
jgi:SAM-dependent methyltransferase